MSSSTMAAVQTARNADQKETTVPASSVQLNGTTRHTAEHVGRSHENGFRFGPSNFVGARSKPEINRNRIVPGQSITTSGFELLDARGSFLSWHECPVDACDAMKRHEGSCKIVRCADRALIKTRFGRREPW